MTDRVHWTGFLPPMRVSTYLAASDLIVMPYRDGASLRRGTLMAALAHGRPVITTHPSPEIAEFRHGENLWLVPPDDAATLVQAITALSTDSDTRLQLSRGAVALGQQFSWASIAAQTADYFRELVAGFPKTAVANDEMRVIQSSPYHPLDVG